MPQDRLGTAIPRREMDQNRQHLRLLIQSSGLEIMQPSHAKQPFEGRLWVATCTARKLSSNSSMRFRCHLLLTEMCTPLKRNCCFRMPDRDCTTGFGLRFLAMKWIRHGNILSIRCKAQCSKLCTPLKRNCRLRPALGRHPHHEKSEQRNQRAIPTQVL